MLSPKSFRPTTFISIGATGAMFTLRERYLRWVGGRDGKYVVCTGHVQNLGQDPDQSFNKAVSLSRERAVELTTTREDLDKELRKIHRSSPEEMAEQRAYEIKMRTEMLDQWVADNDYDTMYQLIKCQRDVFTHGKHAGKSFAEINEFDRDYLEYMAKDDPEYAPKRSHKIIRKLWLQKFVESHPAPEEARDDYYGEVGERIEVSVIVNQVRVVESYYGQSLLIKMTSDEGYRFTSFYSGAKADPEPGDELRVRGTIKKHEEFRGEKSTYINRIAVLEEAA